MSQSEPADGLAPTLDAGALEAIRRENAERLRLLGRYIDEDAWVIPPKVLQVAANSIDALLAEVDRRGREAERLHDDRDQLWVRCNVAVTLLTTFEEGCVNDAKHAKRFLLDAIEESEKAQKLGPPVQTDDLVQPSPAPAQHPRTAT